MHFGCNLYAAALHLCHLLTETVCRWACVSEEEWPNDPNQRQVIISDFDLETKYGDRRQEIVFIGANMDETAICQQLDTALLTEEEMIKYEDRYSTVSAHQTYKLC